MKQRQWLVRAVPGIVLLFLLLRFPEQMTEGVRQGMLLCGRAVIPSVFPFFVLCGFFTRTGLCDTWGKYMNRWMQGLFRLPGTAFGAMALGAIGGYPVGTRMTAELYRSGSISGQAAQRLCLFCVAAGPAFLSGTVGASMLNSRSCGRILFLCVTLSNATIALFLRFAAGREPARETQTRHLPVLRSFCESVSGAGMGMLSLCAWVLLFSGICAVAKTLPDSIATPLCCVLEVTNGCRTAVEQGLVLPILAAIVGFGGVAVHCQILPDVLECGVKLSTFWAFRVLSGALAAVYCKAFLYFFPQTTQVMLLQNGALVEPTGTSIPVSAALLFTAAVFILNTATGIEECRRIFRVS